MRLRTFSSASRTRRSASSRACVLVLGRWPPVLEPIEVTRLAVVVDRCVQRDVGLRHGSTVRAHRRASLLEVLSHVRADPPHGVGREPRTCVRIELLHRPHEAHVAFLDQVLEANGSAGLRARDRNDEGQVVARERLGRDEVTIARAHREDMLLVAAERPEPPGRLEVRGERFVFVAPLIHGSTKRVAMPAGPAGVLGTPSRSKRTSGMEDLARRCAAQHGMMRCASPCAAESARFQPSAKVELPGCAGRRSAERPRRAPAEVLRSLIT